MVENFKKYLVEFIGTFFLMFTVISAVLLWENSFIAPIIIGFALMVMVYAGGHISGGHYNPAVSLACAMRGALDWKHLLPYWLAQMMGAAAGVVLVLLSVPVIGVEYCPFSIGQILFGEFIFAFALCYVVLSTAASKKTQGNSYYGLAIGATVTVGAFAAGGTLCFGAFNPAVAFGLGVSHSVYWSIVVITALANLAGGAVAGCFFKFVENEE